MKKLFSFSMVMFVLASAFWFNTGTVSAASAAVVLYAPGATQQEVKDATMFAGSEYKHVNCVLQDAEAGKVVCRVNGNDSGQSVRIYIGEQVFYVNVPEAVEKPKTALTCSEPEVRGAMFTYEFEGSFYGPYFIAGDTLEIINSNLSEWFWLDSYEIVSGITCGIGKS